MTMSLNQKNKKNRLRKYSAWVFGIAGLTAYNWWVLVPFKPGLMTSFNQLFSDLEIDGRPYSSAMQHADLASGLLLLLAFIIIGNKNRITNFKEYIAMLVFTIGGAIGGIFSETCSDTTSAVCRHLEIRFQLPAHHYLHILAGIVEFGAITFALYHAYNRTKGRKSTIAKLYRVLGRGALIGYPLLALAYLTNRLGGFIEIFFFIAFSIFIVLQLIERTVIKLDKY